MSPYKIYLGPQVFREIKALPGHVRRKIKRAIADLAKTSSSAKQNFEPDPDLKRAA